MKQLFLKSIKDTNVALLTCQVFIYYPHLDVPRNIVPVVIY